MQNTNQEKLKILFIHGFNQSGEIFNQKTKALQKQLKKDHPDCEFLFPDAPFQIIPEGKLAWLYFHKENILQFEEEFKQNQALYNGWNETLCVFQQINQQHPDVNIIIGFSQGAMIATLVLAYRELQIQEQKTNYLFPDLKGTLLFSGIGNPLPAGDDLSFCAKFIDFKCPQQTQPLFKIEIPSLHMTGDEDKYIELWRSEYLMQYYNQSNMEHVRHNGAHFVPQKKEYFQIYEQFMKKCVQKQCDQNKSTLLN